MPSGVLNNSDRVLPSRYRTERLRFQLRSFQRDVAVTRTRRLAQNQNSVKRRLGRLAAPSMRRPPKSRINLPWYRKSSSPTNGRRQEASVSLPSKKGFDFPRASDSAVGRPTGGAARILPFTSSPSPIRPASIRTLVVEHLLRCRLGSSIIQIGCCHLGTELNVSVSSYARSSATSQSPELGD